MKKIILFVLLFVGVLSIDANAQSRYQTTKTLGLGGAGTAYMNGFEALFINPANIFHKRAGTAITIGFAPFNTQLGGPLANITSYNEYFTGGNSYTINQLKNDIVPSFFEGSEPSGLSVNVDVIPVGFTYGNKTWSIAAAARARVITDTRLNSGWMLMMGGLNEELFGTPQALNMSVEALAMTEVSFGFAMPVFKMNTSNGFHRLTVGIAPKYMVGLSYVNLDLQSTMQVNATTGITHDINYEVRANGGINDGFRQYIADKNAGNAVFADLFDGPYFDDATENIASPNNGTGIGFDFGLTYEWEPAFNKDLKFVAAVSLTDFGKLTFKENAGIFGAAGRFQFDGLDYDTDRIDSEFDGEAGDYFEYVLSDSLASNGYGNLQERGTSFTRELPTMLNFGFMTKWKFLTYVLDVGKGFNDFGINSTNVSISNGLEAKFFGFFPIRVGYRMGGFASNAVTFGTGLEFRNYEFSIGTLYTPKSSNGFKLGLALSSLIIRI